MDNKIDLDDIVESRGVYDDGNDIILTKSQLDDCMKEAIRQALVLASEIAPIYDEQGEVVQDKRSILDVNDLVV